MTPRVIFFDINETLLDMQAIKTGLAAVLNGDEALVDLWFANLLHHSLVDTMSAQFHDFIDIGAAALTMVAHGKGIALDKAKAKATIKQHITRLILFHVPLLIEQLQFGFGQHTPIRFLPRLTSETAERWLMLL